MNSNYRRNAQSALLATSVQTDKKRYDTDLKGNPPPPHLFVSFFVCFAVAFQWAMAVIACRSHAGISLCACRLFVGLDFTARKAVERALPAQPAQSMWCKSSTLRQRAASLVGPLCTLLCSLHRMFPFSFFPLCFNRVEFRCSSETTETPVECSDGTYAIGQATTCTVCPKGSFCPDKTERTCKAFVGSGQHCDSARR